ncbi:MAG: hypothetical protein ABGZ53_33185 [Fuerstiella sp.]
MAKQTSKSNVSPPEADAIVSTRLPSKFALAENTTIELHIVEILRLRRT